jgi:integrase
MKGGVLKRCGCRDPKTGKKYSPGKCPRLNSTKRADRDHGSWWARFEAPPSPGGKRNQVWIGPYSDKDEAESQLASEIARLGAGGHVTDRQTLVSEYLQKWLEGKRGLKTGTWNSYEEAVRLYFIPAFGHLRLHELRDHHISDLVTAMMQINRPLPEGEKPSRLLQRLLAVRADDERRELAPGETRHKKSTRPLSPARVGRVMAVLNCALNAAVKSKKLDANPVGYVDLPRFRKPKPLVWTKPRVERWLAKGKIPGPVMVWTPKQTGTFLDFIAEERLYALYHLTAFRGLRRGEDIGLDWTELDLDEALLTVLSSITDDTYDKLDDPDSDDDPKSEAGDRTMSLDPVTVEVMEDWKARQETERAEAGAAWADSGKVFTQRDGSPVRPKWPSQRFDELLKKYEAVRRGFKNGKTVEQLARRHRISEAAVNVALNEPLPPIRFHDLRHGAATLSLAAGVELKVVSEVLGHSKSSFTRDVYTSVIPEVHRAAAEAVASIVPRNRPTRAPDSRRAGKPPSTQNRGDGRAAGRG